MSDFGVRVDLTEAQRLTEAPELRALAKGDGKTAQVLRLAANEIDRLIGELTEARQQLETAQQRANTAEAKLEQPCGSCHPCVNWGGSKERNDSLMRSLELAAAQEDRIRALHQPEDQLGVTVCRTCEGMRWPCSTAAALGAAVNDSSTEDS